MFSKDLKENYPFLTNYFESGISSTKRALSHSILLFGTDIKAQYRFAKETARILNCSEDADD